MKKRGQKKEQKEFTRESLAQLSIILGQLSSITEVVHFRGMSHFMIQKDWFQRIIKDLKEVIEKEL